MVREINFDSVMISKSRELLLSVGIVDRKARELALIHTFKQVFNMIKYANQNGRNPAGMVIDGLRNNWPVPDVLTVEVQERLKQEWSETNRQTSLEVKQRHKLTGNKLKQVIQLKSPDGNDTETIKQYLIERGSEFDESEFYQICNELKIG